jgi:uncharacterized protein (DUF1778 family)
MENNHPSPRGGARPNAGRKPSTTPTGHIQLRVSMAEKNAFVRAAQQSPEGKLTEWMLNAARQRLREGK